MQWRMGSLLIGIALVAPMTAEAECAARIAELEGSAAMADRQSAGSSERIVREDGGETTHQSGGPAVPPDSWFTDSDADDKPSVLTHLESARKARAAGDEQACLDAVRQAEAALRSD